MPDISTVTLYDVNLNNNDNKQFKVVSQNNDQFKVVSQNNDQFKVVSQNDDFEWIVVETKDDTTSIFGSMYTAIKMVNTTRSIVDFASTNCYCTYLIIPAITSVASPAVISAITPVCTAITSIPLPLVVTLKGVEFGVETGGRALGFISRYLLKPVRHRQLKP